MTPRCFNQRLRMRIWRLLTVGFFFPSILYSHYAGADNSASHCPVTEVNDGADDCYTVTAIPGGIEKFDRADADGEWSAASETEKVFNDGRVLFRRNEDSLLMLVVVDSDGDYNGTDTVNIFFDNAHDHTAPYDIHIEIQRNNAVPQKNGSDWFPSGFVIKDTDDPIGDTLCNTAPCGIYGLAAGAHAWSAEIKISAQDLGSAFLPSIMGTSITTVRSSPFGKVVSKWPAAFIEDDPTTWANIKTRYPLHYALVLDFSGSMRTTDGLSLGSRWARAKRAADLFAATAGLFKNPYFQDRISLSQYSWLCNDSSEAGNTIGEVDGIPGSTSPVTLPGAPGEVDATFTQGNTIEPDPNNCTPIKRGIDFALFNQLGFGGPAVQEDRMILLLSDGLHNRPPADVPFDPLDPAVYTSDQKQFAAIRTVAMGDDCCIDTQLLQEIAIAFNGASPVKEARYNFANEFQELLAAYIESLQQPLSINEIPAIMGSYPVGEVEKLVVIGVWNDPSQASDLTIGTVGANLNNVPGDKFNSRIGYAAVAVENPQVGNWEVKSVSGATAPDKLFFLVDLRVMARFWVEQKPYGAGDTILLQVKLNDRAAPVRDAEVAVEVAKPGEGLGNFLSTVQEDCSMGRPAASLSTRYRFDPRTHTFRVPAARGGNLSHASDPLPGRHALAAYHLDRCKRDDLGRRTLPGLKLYDDGSHGDPRADDGIYSLAFSDTDKEGSYQFRFHVLGTTADGIRFTRTRTLAQHARINPVRWNSLTAFQPGDPRKGQQRGTVTILPRDRLGNYLGPGFHHRIEFKTTSGQFIQPLIDHGDGTYSRLLSYDKEKERPKINIEMGGQEIGRLKVVKDVDLVLPFIGWFNFDDELDLEDGPLVGTRFGYLFTNRLFLELEGGNTFTETTAGETGNVVQAMINVRYQLTTKPTTWGQLTPFVTAGLGYLFFDGFGNDDEAFAIQGGAGATFNVNDTFGIRLDARIFRVESVMQADPSVNYQAAGGLVVRF